MSRLYRLVFKVPSAVLGVLSLYLWFSALGIYDDYLKHKPSVPRPETGEILSLANHGTYVYISSADHAHLYGRMAAAPICGLLAGLCYLIERQCDKRFRRDHA